MPVQITVPVGLSPATLPDGTQGVPYSQTLTATGGTGSYSFAVTADAPPPGLMLSSDGVLAGKPTASGTFSFIVTVTDTAGGKDQRRYDLKINASPIVLAPTTLPPGQATVAYNQKVTATGGREPYKYAVTSGALPDGIVLDANTGALTGAPKAAGSSTFTITATDANNATGSQQYALLVTAPPGSVTLSPATLPDGTVNTAYSQTIVANNGQGTFTFAVTQGSLPQNLSLSSSGVISGTPTVAGMFSFTITATVAPHRAPSNTR